MKRLLLAASVLILGACRGSVSEDPPIHLIPDMDWQPKYLPQSKNAFFEDKRAERPIVEGTVARGTLHDPWYDTGKIGDAFLNKIPDQIKVDEKLLRHGEERFNIYCAPCHDRTGSGNGLVFQHGYPTQPTNLAGDDARSFADGQLFDAITNGIRNMPAYGHMIPTADRWAIVAWVRVLQRSQHTTVADVPPDMAHDIKPEEKQ